MATPAERQQMIAEIRSFPAAFEAMVTGLDAVQLSVPEGEGEWSIRQIVHHVADSHLNLFLRVKLTLTEERPTLRPYDQERWAELPDTRNAPIESSLSILRGLHDRCAALLEAVPGESWGRPAFHPESGELTLEDLLVTWAHHGVNHIEQIARIRSAKRW